MRVACRRALSFASACRSTRRQPRTIRSTWAAVPPRPTPSSRSSVSGVATRVRARTLAYESSPRARAWARSGSVPRARATRTFSRAAPRSSPTRQLSQAAQERNPVFQAPAGVELADQVEEASAGGLQVRRQLGDLVAQPVQLRNAVQRGGDVWRVNLHGESPFY